MLLIFGSRAGLFLASDDEFDDAWVEDADVLAELDAIEAQAASASAEAIGVGNAADEVIDADELLECASALTERLVLSGLQMDMEDADAVDFGEPEPSARCCWDGLTRRPNSVTSTAGWRP